MFQCIAGLLPERARHHIGVVFGEKDRIASSLGIGEEERLYIFLIDEKGDILWKPEGAVKGGFLGPGRVRGKALKTSESDIEIT